MIISHIYLPLLQNIHIFRLKFRHSASQILDGRQLILRFVPCLTKFYPEIFWTFCNRGKYINDVQKNLAESLEKCWDEDRFIRGIREDGVVVGAKKILSLICGLICSLCVAKSNAITKAWITVFRMGMASLGVKR